MTIILYGFQDGIVNGQSLYDLPSAFSYVGAAYWGQVPVSVVVTAAIFIGVGLFLRYHRIGREIYAVGGNREAARAAGIASTASASACTSPAACSPRSAA